MFGIITFRTMKDRRHFLKGTLLGAVGALLLPKLLPLDSKKKTNPNSREGYPMVISTWNHGLAANEAAMQRLKNGGKAIDAVEEGVKVPEADPESTSVGYGGLPDRDGHVTLDACIMDLNGNCGAVSFLEHIKHPISVATRISKGRLTNRKVPSALGRVEERSPIQTHNKC